MKSIARSLRITSKKINLVAGLVRRKDVTEAMNILKFTPKKGAKILSKIIQSAIANAENNFKQEKPSLYIQEIVVTEAPTMKRSIPVSRGRSNPILKRNSHVSVFLGVKGEEAETSTKGAKAKTTEEPKKTTSKTTVTVKKATPKKKITKE
ncbi:MAG: 50S ribosomal protein L22 [Candidatus Gracilibacteria bacterium]|jgi:large subunit ribosomal protein L22